MRPRARALLFGHAADIARGVLERARSSLGAARGLAPLVRAATHSFLGVSRTPSSRRVQRNSAASPRRRTSAMMPRTHALPCGVVRAGAPPASSPRNRECQPHDAHHSTILFSGYSTMPCACAAFSRGNQVPHHVLVHDGVDGHPVGVRKRRDGRILERRQRTQHAVEMLPAHVQHDPHFVVRGDGALAAAAPSWKSSRASRDPSPRRIGDEHGARFQHRVDDAQPVGPQRRSRLRDSRWRRQVAEPSPPSRPRKTPRAPPRRVRARYFWVRFTTSVAITFPSGPSPIASAPSSGTASTQRTGARLCLAYSSSPISARSRQSPAPNRAR